MDHTQSAIIPAPALSGLEAIAPKRSNAPSLPSWFVERSTAAWQTFQDLPVPTIKDENWRYSSAKLIPLADLQPASVANSDQEKVAIAASTGLKNPAAKLVFLNDRLIHSETGDLPEGIVCLSLEQALKQHSDLLEAHFMQRDHVLGSAKYAALHLAHVQAGAVVLAKKGVELAGSVEVFHWVAGEASSIFPHTLIIAEDLAKVSVVEHYRSLDEKAGFSCAVADFIAKPGSKITYSQSQELNRQSVAMHLSSTTADRDASVMSFQLQLGAAFARSENVSDLIGAGSRSDMLSGSLPMGDQRVDQRTLQCHKAPHATSDLLYKNALYDKSKTVFSGLITVDEGAHYTDAYQTCRNLLNSDDAEADSMPGLEINADQVKCSHGSTSGPISDDELFYLKARGIPDGEARHLIVRGFLADALGRFHDEEIAELMKARIDVKMSALS